MQEQLPREQKSALLPTVLKTQPEATLFRINLSIVHSHITYSLPFTCPPVITLTLQIPVFSHASIVAFDKGFGSRQILPRGN